MRVVDRKTFLRLPAGVAYVKVSERWCTEGGISFKGSTVTIDGKDIDWCYWDPAWVDGHDSGECLNRLDDMIDRGLSYPMQSAAGRDGCFDEGDMFMVFERDDLDLLIEAMQQARAVMT